MHDGAHAPVVHTRPLPQTVAQVPQCPLSDCRFASQPSTLMPLQLLKFVLQAPSVHAPAVQAAAALVKLQTTPQPPQLLVVLSAVSQPLAGLPSQLAKPAAQVIPQVLPEQTAVEFAPDGHTVPHAPHEIGSLVRLRQLVPHAVSPVPHEAAHAPVEQT
jgi:hypothetical protein